MKISEVKHWRGCELLEPFFSITAASTALDETTVGKVVDFLLSELDKRKELLDEAMQFCQRIDCDGDPLNIHLARKIHKTLQA